MTGEPFSFDNEEGFPIRGDVHRPERPGPPIVLVHGFKGFKDWGFWPETASRLADAGYAVVRFNFSHSGIGSDLTTFTETRLFESGTYSREVSDLREVLSRLCEGKLPGSGGLDASRIGLLGHSRGSIASLAIAAQEPRVRSVVLWNPVADVLWWDEPVRRRWRESGSWEVVNTRTHQVFRVGTQLLDDAELNRERLDPISNAARLAIPVLAVVAREDESVAPESGRKIARAVPGSQGIVHEIPETGHTFGAAHPFQNPAPAFDRAFGETSRHFQRTLPARSA